MLLVFAVIFSVSAISASDANVTDSYATNLVDDTQDVSVLMENTADSSESSVSSDSNVDNDPSKVSLSSEDVLESGDSNTLSTNIASDVSNGESEVVSASSSNQDVISAMEEKPAVPKSNWCCPPFYFYTKEDSHRIPEAIREGCGVDAPGSYIAWLCKKTRVHAMEMPGSRYDIGNLESYELVQKTYRGITK